MVDELVHVSLQGSITIGRVCIEPTAAYTARSAGGSVGVLADDGMYLKAQRYSYDIGDIGADDFSPAAYGCRRHRCRYERGGRERQVPAWLRLSYRDEIGSAMAEESLSSYDSFPPATNCYKLSELFLGL